MSTTRDDREEALERAAALRTRFTETELRRFFCERSHDSLFEYIGRAALAGVRDRVATYIFVWTGFEVAVRNQYSVLAPDSFTEAAQLG